MKTRLYDALSILAELIRDKLGIKENITSELPNIVASMQISLASQIAAGKRSGYITEDNYVLVDELESKIRQQFSMYPIMNLPLGVHTFTVTLADINLIFKKLKAKAIVEDIICLPYQV